MIDKEIEQLEAIYELLTQFLVTYSFQLVGALIIVIIGIWLGGRVAILIERSCAKRDLDVTLSRFFASTAKLLVIAIMLIIALGKIGVSIGPFVAALGAISLGAGLAIQSPLSNYGAGLNLILTRPFVVGDTITVQNVTGIVREIRLAYTILGNEDDVQITIPNRHIIGEIIHNSHADTLIELEVGISYNADPVAASKLIQQALASNQLMGSRDRPVVGIDQFGDNNIVLAIRLWAPSEKHYQIRYQANELVYATLKEANIEIAYPQREIKLLS